MVLAVNKEPVTCFRDIENACQALDNGDNSGNLNMTIFRQIKHVYICEATLSKRLIEFENTNAGALTMEEFTEKERELRTSSLTRKQPNTGSKETSLDEVLCRHNERKPFAYGLYNECYEEFMKVSRGLDGG
ncbi:hypothetical protein ES332_D11G224300v1 [Gossypium tomentosum]|uniref:Uncharacterized protein n=1 Tax=Gossypium tomentosum TaxID=34277 RepID=A0A5D2IQY0_GOSTO|nr:hypothetical protein ES332_D11G224300v1 [Gossypium tomentosum]